MALLLTDAPARRAVPVVADRPAPLAAARQLAPLVATYGDEIEAGRRLPRPLLAELVDAGLFHLLTPRAFGGGEVEPVTMLGVVEEIAKVDGSTAWVLMINNNGGLVTAYLDDRAGREIFRDNRRAILGGALIPSGTAVEAPGGYRVTGRWGFGSGVEHSAWVVAACRVDNGIRAMILRADDVQIVDTWDVGGLRGTGSHDFVVKDAFVPAARSFWVTDPLVQTGPLYRFPVRGLGAAGIATVALGIARGAIDAFTALAAAKTPTMSQHPLRERPLVALQLAQAEATVRSARAWLFESVQSAWASVTAGDIVTPTDQALLRLAATHAAARAAEAVDIVRGLAGGSAVYTSSPLERKFRDVHTATQHFTVQPSMYEPIGRALLHLPPTDQMPL